MVLFGLYEWLSPPQPGSRCSLPLNVKKSIFLVLAFTLVAVLGAGVFFLIPKLHLVLPLLVHGVILVLEAICFLFFIHGVFAEKPRFLLGLVAIEALRVALFTVLSVFYVVKMFAADEVAPENETARHYGIVLGHVFVVLLGYLFLAVIAVFCYRRYRMADIYCTKGVPMPAPVAGHNVITLEQPIEEAMYGRKRDL